MRPLVLAAAALALASGPARAWSVHGHQIVALIAEDKLKRESPEALAWVNSLLRLGWVQSDPSYGPPTMRSVSACADQVRYGVTSCSGLQLQVADPKATAPWHFVNIPISDPQPDVEKYCQGSCVVDQVKAELAALKEPATTPAQKQTALVFMIHLVGDMHQPLHCAYGIYPDKRTKIPGPDYGGNEEMITFENAPLSLHALWDHLIEPTDLLDAQQTAAALGSSGAGSADDVLSGKAALDSFHYAQDRIYEKFFDNVPFDEKYQAEAQKEVFDRLETAGVSLASLLEQAYAAQKPPVQASVIGKF